MNYKSKAKQAVSLLFIFGMLLSVPTINSEAAVITSNATDKAAVVFNENTAYSAGDYITYDGEMYLCTEDIQGPWSMAGEHFLQITKNHELGKSEDLSAAYDDAKDPAQETSLMAFAANVWQKLKGFLGIGGLQETDSEHYKDASVSAKLNYLEQQNGTLTANVSGLKESVDRSFQSVSNGKNLLANAITGSGGTASSSYTFQQFSQAISNLAQSKYQEGITFADGRVNTDSESYKQGASSSSLKEYSAEVKLNYNGPDCEREFFVMEGDVDHHSWKFKKEFEGHQIVGIFCGIWVSNPYESWTKTQTGVRTNSGFKFSQNIGSWGWSVSNGSAAWGDFGFSLGSADSSYVRLQIKIMYI